MNDSALALLLVLTPSTCLMFVVGTADRIRTRWSENRASLPGRIVRALRAILAVLLLAFAVAAVAPTFGVGIVLALSGVGLFVASWRIGGRIRSTTTPVDSSAAEPAADDQPLAIVDANDTVAVLIACKNGASSIVATILSATPQAPVFVVSDGSTDETAQTARRHGACVLELPESVGKPAALRHLLDFEPIGGRTIVESYTYILIIDDDTVLDADYVEKIRDELRKPGVVAASGQVRSEYPSSGSLSWNPWVAARAWATWRTQLLLVRGQAVLRMRTWISGATTAFRADVLDRVCTGTTPYIVDDTFWCYEIHRQNLGNIAFVPNTSARIQEPLSARSLYAQDVRWAWGSWQGILGHRLGRQRQRADIGILLLLSDMFLYVIVGPLLLAGTLVVNRDHVGSLLTQYFAGYIVTAAIGAVVLRRPKLFLLWPGLLAYDWLYRFAYINGAIKAFHQPTVERCAWESPTRFMAKPF